MHCIDISRTKDITLSDLELLIFSIWTTDSGSICRRSRLFSKCIIGWEHGKVVQIGGSTVWCALHRI
jgi:hypothetical protein